MRITPVLFATVLLPCLLLTGCSTRLAPPNAPPAPDTVAILPNINLPPDEVINLWPGTAPGETGKFGPEHILTDRPRPFDQITDVTVPTLAVFQPAADKRTGTGVLVIPGGGLDRLALETEGYEVVTWLNDHGITAFLLKYRVPRRSPTEAWKVGVQDAQRAMGLIRAHAGAWKVEADAIGSIGFSAGAEINVRLSVLHAEPRQYPRVDAADDLSSRPDFNIAMYGGGFADARANTLNRDVAARINASTPPMFIAHAFDDQALSSIILMNALKRANVPSELHIFGAGAHGFGVRDTGLPLNGWRELCLNWLAWQGFLDPSGVRAFARDFIQARDSGAATLPRFSVAAGTGDLGPAYAAQRRLVAHALAHGGEIAGYKGAYTSEAAQARIGVTAPAHGVLFKAGRISASPAPAIALNPSREIFVETEIGYVIATDIGTKLRVPRQALTAVEALVPVIELPVNATPLMGGTIVAADAVAGNIGSNQFIVGQAVAPMTGGDLDALAVTLQRDGQTLHEAKGAEAKGGQAAMLMALINKIVEQGHVLHRGDLIISGALGGPKPGEKGSYTANFGALGTIAFKLQ